MKSIQRLVVLAILTAILFVFEEALAFLPNIQVTVLLLFVYTKCLNTKEVTLIILIHTLLDNLFMSSFNIFYTSLMFLGWMNIVLCLKVFFKKITNPLLLACISVLCAFIYSFIFLIGNVLIYEVRFLEYWIADLPFEALLALSSFITVLWLYEPLSEKLMWLLRKSEEVK